MGEPDYKELARIARQQANSTATRETRKALLELAERYEAKAKHEKPTPEH